MGSKIDNPEVSPASIFVESFLKGPHLERDAIKTKGSTTCTGPGPKISAQISHCQLSDTGQLTDFTVLQLEFLCKYRKYNTNFESLL